jgi:protein-tyrosine-phosphatase
MTAAFRRLRHLVWVLRTLPPMSRRWAVRRLLESHATRQRRLEAALAAAPGRLVFVCYGNIMRSAFAAESARAMHPAVAPRIIGAGTHAKNGRAAQDSAIRVALAFGVSLDGHRATSLQSVALTAQDLVVCMDIMNEANVLAHLGRADRVFLVGDIVSVAASHGDREVADPYGKGDAVTEQAFATLATLSERWVAAFAGASRR